MKDIIIKGVIGYDVFAEDIRKELPAGSEKIRLLINSPGGDVYEAFEIYNMLKEYPGKVTARITGLAASAAAALFFGADEREAFTHAALMYHRAWCLSIGNATDLREEADILDGLDKILISDFIRITGKSLEVATKEFTDETWLIGAEQMAAAGIGITIVDDKPDEEKQTKPEAQARVKVAIAVIRELAEDNKAQRLDKIAALLRPEKQDTPAIRAVVDNAHKGETVMNLDEFIKQNPGAESEILAYAKNKIGPEADKAVKAESERISEILALAGVNISDDVKAALTGGISPEAYAKNALIEQRKIEAGFQAKESALSPGKVNQTLAEQTGAKAEKQEPADIATEDSVKALARELGVRR